MSKWQWTNSISQSNETVIYVSCPPSEISGMHCNHIFLLNKISKCLYYASYLFVKPIFNAAPVGTAGGNVHNYRMFNNRIISFLPKPRRCLEGTIRFQSSTAIFLPNSLRDYYIQFIFVRARASIRVCKICPLSTRTTTAANAISKVLVSYFINRWLGRNASKNNKRLRCIERAVGRNDGDNTSKYA